jgi:hypothetical protein
MIVHQHVEAISTTEQVAKWMQSMEHARRIDFTTDMLMPLGGKSKRLLPPIAKQPQDMTVNMITVKCVNSLQPVMEKFDSTHLPLLLPSFTLLNKVYITARLGMIPFPSYVEIYFHACNQIKSQSHTRDMLRSGLVAGKG